VHGPYEDAVDRRVPDYPFRYDDRDAARPAVRTRRVTRAAHQFYRELLRAYDHNGYNRKVHRITKGQLQRAANTLADLIAALE
jgi:hypothetical protein